jgi:hypothetical protein
MPSLFKAFGSAPDTSPKPPVFAKGTASEERNATLKKPLHRHHAPQGGAENEPDLTAESEGYYANERRFCQEKAFAKDAPSQATSFGLTGRDERRSAS